MQNSLETPRMAVRGSPLQTLADPLARNDKRPEADTRSINVGGDLRPQAGTRYNRQLAKNNRPRHLLVIMNERIINSA